jgi:hypothetical protein
MIWALDQQYRLRSRIIRMRWRCPFSIRWPIALALLLEVPLIVLAASPLTFSDANWVSLGSGISGGVSALAVLGTNLYAGGPFTTDGGAPASFVARWDGSAWSALGSGVNYNVKALAVSRTNLYAGGSFTKQAALLSTAWPSGMGAPGPP